MSPCVCWGTSYNLLLFIHGLSFFITGSHLSINIGYPMNANAWLEKVRCRLINIFEKIKIQAVILSCCKRNKIYITVHILHYGINTCTGLNTTCHHGKYGPSNFGKQTTTSFPGFSLLLRERTLQVTAGHVAPKIWEPKIREGKKSRSLSLWQRLFSPGPRGVCRHVYYLKMSTTPEKIV